jgi:predicted regulator of Ras-like GTPase activity (Roadblock/LC7/MglB family)
MHSLLERVRSRNAALDSLVVVTAEGRPLAHAGADEARLQTIAGLVTALHGLADRAAAELGAGGLESLVVHGHDGFFALASIDQGRYVVASTGERTMTGAVLADLRTVAAGLRAEAA